MIDLMKLLPARTHTITKDNGKEFASHERIAKELNTDVCFAHLYSSWERATDEKMIESVLSEEAQSRNNHSAINRIRHG